MGTVEADGLYIPTALDIAAVAAAAEVAAAVVVVAAAVVVEVGTGTAEGEDTA